MNIVAKMVMFAVGFVFGMSPREVNMVMATVKRFDDRYHVKFHRTVSHHDDNILTEQTSFFLQEHEREPTEQEIDAILDAYILH